MKTLLTSVAIVMLTVLYCQAETIHFHSDFDEGSLAAIAGLTKDAPLPASNNFDLNTTNDTLEFANSASANMWTSRDNAPVAWVANPNVAIGQTWAIETYVSMQKDGANNEEIGGITFYANADGATPDFTFGLHDWGGWHARLQRTGNNPNVAGDELGSATGVFLRTEITEGGAADTYNFFYKLNSNDAWMQLTGAAQDYSSSNANARAGIFLKNDGDGGAAQFDYLTVTVVPEPAALGLATLGLFGLVGFRRQRGRG
jgi:hypothetical protein